MLHFYIDVKDKSLLPGNKKCMKLEIGNLSWKEGSEQCSYLFFFT